MGTLQIQNINLAFGDLTLLNEVSFTLSSGDHVALAGGNGAGKTTLLKVIKGELKSDSGAITLSRGMRIAYLPQAEIVHANNTLYGEVELVFNRFNPLLKRQGEIERILATLSEDEDHLALSNELSQIQEKLLEGPYYRRRAIIEQILKGLGFTPDDLERPCEEFSGGWQMRIALAKVLVEDAEVMLLDEPTNYLDIDSLLFLRSFIKSYQGIAILVSHDQDFLDETVSVVYELFHGKLTPYRGNYSNYLVQREEELVLLEKRYKEQQREIAKTEQFIERFRYKATKARQVQSRIKQLEKVPIIEIPSHLQRIKFSFPEGPHSPNDVVRVANLAKSYGEHEIFNNFSMLVNKGDRLAITGRNGSGKTTLLRILAQIDLDYEGEVKVGPGIKIGYFAQDSVQYLNLANTVLQEVEGVASTDDFGSLRSLLGAFLFRGDEVDKRVSVLSGGERSRLALAKILLHPANLLILDEPTSHLDINAKNVLLEALQTYKGTLIFVSHDTHFIKNIANRILYLSETKEELFEGDWSYFAWKMGQREEVEEEVNLKAVNNTTFEWQEEKRLKNRYQNLVKEGNRLLEEIELLDQEINRVIDAMALEENYSERGKIVPLLEAKERLERERNHKEEAWFKCHNEVEELKALYGF